MGAETAETIPDWPTIREIAVTGARTLRQIARDFGLNEDRVKRRALRQNWPIPSRIRAAAQNVPNTGGNARLSPNVPDGQKVSISAAKSLAELGEQGALTGAQLLHGLLRRAANNPGKLKGLADAGDIATAVRGLNAATGREVGTVNVGLLLGLLAGGGRDQIEVIELTGDAESADG